MMNPLKLCRAAALTMLLCSTLSQAQTESIGLANVHLTPQGADEPMPRAPHRGPALSGAAAPTNQWHSSLAFGSETGVLFAQPLAVKPTLRGLEVSLPLREARPSVRRDVEIHYPHQDPITIEPLAFPAGTARLERASVWAIEIGMGREADRFEATVAHGSPFVHLRVSRGDLRVSVPAGTRRLASNEDPRRLLLESAGRRYALFGPTGVRWEEGTQRDWIARMPDAARGGYLAAAALPDAHPRSLDLIARHAYVRLRDTEVGWHYEAATSQVTTRFTARVEVLEGEERAPLLGLYPHHWHDNPGLRLPDGPAYDTVRGKVRLLAADTFTTRRTYPGFVPFWPALQSEASRARVGELAETDLRDARRMMLQEGQGAYWQGKGLQRNMLLLQIVEQQGDARGRDRLLEMLKKRMEEWFSGRSRKSYFALDRTVGAVASYPDEFFTVRQINDHHFTYGYWIRTAAEIALRDPSWAERDRWGAMIELLIADIATQERGRGDFPFVRAFDPYEGHSWASGIGIGPYGNNQESSSEAMNAWAALILWAEATGNTALRDLGVWLYTTEADAIDHYWFDRHGLVFAPEYGKVEVSQLFGAAYIHNTWWTDEPRQIKGINLLPITSASLYLGRDPAYVRRNLGTLPADMKTYAQYGRKPSNPPPADIWQDLFAKYLALADPELALKQWERWGSVELGDTRTHALHWMLSLQEMGTPDFGVTADTTLYSVFRRPDGVRTYLAYNAEKVARTVRFSDGTTLDVAPHTLARAQGRP